MIYKGPFVSGILWLYIIWQNIYHVLTAFWTFCPEVIWNSDSRKWAQESVWSKYSLSFNLTDKENWGK